MLRSISLLLISLALLTGCGNNDIIPEKDMVKILCKMHLIDGTMSMPNAPVEMDKINADSVDYYSKMFESYGYTAKQFSNSYYYYLGRPEMLDDIYDKVIAKLEVENQRIEDSLAKEALLAQYWNLSSFWRIQGKGSAEMIEFSIPISQKGTYTLKMSALVGEVDNTPSLKAIIGTSANNATAIENLENKQEVTIKKSGKVENYTFTITIPESKPVFIKGRLLDFKKDGTTQYNRSVIIRKITLSSPQKEQAQKKAAQKKEPFTKQ